MDGDLFISDDADGVDPATKYPFLTRLGIENGQKVSGLLEVASIRHCLFGDVVAEAAGSDALTGHTYLIVSDPQIAAADNIISATGDYRHAATQTVDPMGQVCSDFGLAAEKEEIPGCCFVDSRFDAQDNPGRTILVPASFLHFDLGPENYTKNTVLIQEPRCRMPNILRYLDALISFLATRRCEPERKSVGIDLYFMCQLLNIKGFLPRSLINQLPPEDLLFMELINKLILPSAKKKLCLQWRKIRSGETTVDEARKRVPRVDLEFAAFKIKVQERLSAAAAGKEDQPVQPE